MKKINIIFISAIVALLMGCATEMKINEQLNVTLEKSDTWYCGVAYSINDLKDMYSVYVTDSNDQVFHLSYGEYKFVPYEYYNVTKETALPYYFDNTEDAIVDVDEANTYLYMFTDSTADVRVKLLYTIGAASNGVYYNYGTQVPSIQKIHFKKIPKSEIDFISLNGEESTYLKGRISSGDIILKFGWSLKVNLKSGESYEIDYRSQTWSITGIDEFADVGTYTVVGHYEDLTTDGIKVNIIEL